MPRQAVAEISERCITCLYEVVKATQFAKNSTAVFLEAYRPTDLEAPLDGLAAVPLHQLGDVRMVQAVMAMRQQMGRVRLELDEHYRHVTDASGHGLNVDALASAKTLAFNAHASIVRITYGVVEAQERLRRYNG